MITGVSKPSATCRRYQTTTMGTRSFGLFSLTIWLSLTWSLVEASVPTCQSLKDDCFEYGLDCQQRLAHSFIQIPGSCGSTMNDPLQPCSTQCNMALELLVHLPVSGWFTCDCTGFDIFSVKESQCLDIQNNLVTCSNYPLPVASTANSVPVARTPGHLTTHTTRPPTSTCTAAKTVCDEVASCQAALRNVMSVCDVSGSAIENDDNVCSMMCVKAMNKLEEQQTQAVQLWGCDCLEESRTVRGDSPMSVPWCYIFSDAFLEECVSTEERHVTYGPLSSPKESNKAEKQVGDKGPGGNGTPSPRLSSPQRWLYLVTICVLAIMLDSNQRNL